MRKRASRDQRRRGAPHSTVPASPALGHAEVGKRRRQRICVVGTRMRVNALGTNGSRAPWLPHGTGASVEGVEVAGRRASFMVASVVRRGLRHSPLSAVVPGEELAPVLLAVFAVLVATAVPFRALA
jgi:hypothetical protein